MIKKVSWPGVVFIFAWEIIGAQYGKTITENRKKIFSSAKSNLLIKNIAVLKANFRHLFF